jgi:hypothetical protein
MIQHVRRRIARFLPAPEVNIPLPAVLQTAVVGVLMVTLRFSSLLFVGVTVVGVVRADVVPSEVLMALTVAAWSDRSAFCYLKIRRAG